jgi:predicted transcriptional regulator
MSATTTLKLPPELRARVARLAKASGRSAHGLMLQAIEREVDREERVQAFVQEALEADRSIEAGGEVYAAEDVHAWIERLANGKRAPRPKPWSG